MEFFGWLLIFCSALLWGGTDALIKLVTPPQFNQQNPRSEKEEEEKRKKLQRSSYSSWVVAIKVSESMFLLFKVNAHILFYFYMKAQIKQLVKISTLEML